MGHQFNFPQGLIQTRRILSRYGLLTIGDGQGRAHLLLTGVSNVVSGGLVIKRESMLTFSGLIDGVIQNEGTIQVLTDNSTVTFTSAVTNLGVMDFSKCSKVTFSKALLNKGTIKIRDAQSLDSKSLINQGQVIETPQGFEGDIAPRPGGNGVLTAADLTIIGRLVAGLEAALTPEECQPADMAPQSSFGNGILNAGDLTQVAR